MGEGNRISGGLGDFHLQAAAETGAAIAEGDEREFGIDGRESEICSHEVKRELVN